MAFKNAVTLDVRFDIRGTLVYSFLPLEVEKHIVASQFQIMLLKSEIMFLKSSEIS